MKKIVRRLVYSKLFFNINTIILSIFFDKKYLKGKYFEEQRYGFVWAWRSLKHWIKLRNRNIKWPVSKYVSIPNGKNIEFDVSSINVFQSRGCYFQNHVAKIKIGKNCYIAPNVGIITANHDPENLDLHMKGKDVVIGNDCWIGMNAVVLPGVILGDKTIVGAGSVVTKSFPEGHIILGGTPAKVIRSL